MLKKTATGILSLAIIAGSVTSAASAASVKVGKGDTLYSIAKENKLSVSELKKLNKLQSDIIYVGQVLTTSKAVTPTSKTYKVKAGDTLWKISRQYGVSVNEIKSWNKLKSNTLRIGQSLKISKPAASAPTPPKKNEPAPPKGNATYQVRSGDTLWSISKRYDLTVDQLRAMNGLSNNIIHTGQTLSVVKKVLFIRPSDGNVTSGFGVRIDPITGVKDKHNGVDFAKSGTVAINAAAAGTVSQSYLSKSYGEVVFVAHNLEGKTYETVYAHMRSGSRTVRVGDHVKQGQRLGYMGNTGYSTGQHLHFELHEGRWNIDKTKAVDPLSYLP